MYNAYFNPQQSIDRINNQIKDLENLKNQYQHVPQQPMNVFNVGNAPQIEFEARYLKENENVDEILVQRKTAFISPENGFLKVKDTDGTITTYELIPPKDAKDLKIDELKENNSILENKLKEMEAKINELSINNLPDDEIGKSSRNVAKLNKK